MDEIKAQYEHSKFGTFMFNLCAGTTKFLVKHKWLYFLLACTWGFLMTFIGWVISLVLAICKIFDKTIKFEKYLWIYDIKVGPEYWGGFEMGLMFCRDHKSWDDHINAHEFGHTFQNCILGPLMPFIVSIPSATRYWLMEIFTKKDWPAYDAIWFEDAASQCGKYAAEHILKKENKNVK